MTTPSGGVALRFNGAMTNSQILTPMGDASTGDEMLLRIAEVRAEAHGHDLRDGFDRGSDGQFGGVRLGAR